MRTDLTAAFIAAKNSSSRKPRQLLVFQFPVAGNVYVSDQAITLGGHVYQALVESWGELSDAAGAESDFTAETRQVSVTLWNGGSNPFSTYFLKEDPENVEVLLYQWFDGLADAAKLLLDRFVVQDPIAFDEASRLLTLDLVSINMRYVGRCGGTVTTALWPNALPEHVGQAIPLIFGDAGECNTLCVKTAPRATLFGSIAIKSMTIECNESLAAAGFPASGYLQIEDELIPYSSRTDKVFTASFRGWNGSGKVSHPDGAEVHQYITDHTYLIGEMSQATITDVRVDGYPAPAGSYVTALVGTYAKIFFNQKPYSYQYASSAQTMELFAFVTCDDNTAWQAHYAYDQNKTSSGAMINEVYPILSIELPKMTLTSLNGLLTTAYLAVHHWETNLCPNDYVEVWVEGIGVVGRLARPNPEDIYWLEAEVDVDHEHEHATGDSHTHTHNDAAYWATASGHVHQVDGDGTVADGDCNYAFPIQVEPPMNGSSYADLQYSFTYPDGALWTKAQLRLRIDLASVKVVVTCGGATLWEKDKRATGSGGYDVTLNVSTRQNGIKFTVYGSNVVGAYAYIKEASHTWFLDSTMLDAADAVTPYLDGSQPGTNVETYNTNQPDDVIPLLTDNRAIDILSKKSPARTLIDRFDLSDYIDPTWQWFPQRKVQVRYVGTTNDVNVFIPFITFELEFRPRERVFSNRVTATVSGSTSRRPDQVLQTLLDKAGLPSSYIDSASFTAAGSWFAANSYTIDGVIDGSLTVAEAIKKVCWQARARLYWSGGKAHLTVRKKPADFSIGKYLTADHYQLKSIKATRQPVAELINRIELFYNFKRTPDQAPALVPLAPKGRLKPSGGKGGAIMTTQGQPFLSSLIKEDAISIAAHGLREQPDAFLCDLVRNYSMALSVADYYLTTLAYPSTLYEFNTYLPQIELEKEDILALTSAGFHKIRKMPLRIKEVSRLFGSGKNRTINHLRIIAECLRYVLVEVGAADQVLIMDSLTATIGKLVDMADAVHAQDVLTSAETAGLADEALIEDALEIIFVAFATLEETMTIADELSCGLSLALEDGVTVSEQLTVWRDFGFGSGDFGTCGFGGVKTWQESDAEVALFTDQIGVGIGVVIDLIDRGVGPVYTDSIAILTDRLAISNQFGSAGTISSGFGNIPFGG